MTLYNLSIEVEATVRPVTDEERDRYANGKPFALLVDDLVWQYIEKDTATAVSDTFADNSPFSDDDWFTHGEVTKV